MAYNKFRCKKILGEKARKLEDFFTPLALLSDEERFTQFGTAHLCWLLALGVLIAALCVLYRTGGKGRRNALRRAVGGLILLCEVLRVANLARYGVLTVYNLPLHLCSLAVFFAFDHSLRPGETVGNLLYSTCMPGALFALIFPDWTVYSPLAFHSCLSFIVHALIVAYPLMQTIGGDLRPQPRLLPRCALILLLMAGGVYIFDRLYSANYMFLLEPAPGSPLEWFAAWLGNPGYLLGYIPLALAVWAVLYLPFMRRRVRAG